MSEADVIDLAERRERARTGGPSAFARVALGLAVIAFSICLLFGRIP